MVRGRLAPRIGFIAAFVALILAGPGCGGGIRAGQRPIRASASLPQQLRRLVADSQRAGYERHDLRTFLAARDPEGRYVLGRGPEPDDHDIEWNGPSFFRSRQLLFEGQSPPDRRLHMANVEVTVRGDEAVLTSRTSLDDAAVTEVMGEHYVLHPTADGAWKIHEQRAWPIRVVRNDTALNYDDETWRRLDADIVIGERERWHPRRMVGLYVAAYRLRSAYAIALDLTRAPAPTREDWMTLAALAAVLGESAEATLATRQIELIDRGLGSPQRAR